MTQKKSFKKKVILITGGAKGLGADLVDEFCKIGATVIFLDIDRNAGVKKLKAKKTAKFDCHFYPIDLRDESEIIKVISKIGKKFGIIDVLINNARAPLESKRFPDSMAGWGDAISIMLTAPILLIMHCLPFLQKAKNPSIINLSSTNAKLISQQPISYSVAKAAILQATKQLSCELGNNGIRVNAILPGLIDIADRNIKFSDNDINIQITKNIVPLGRAATSQEIFNLAYFLAGEESLYITGQEFIIDGGLTLVDQFFASKKIYDSISIPKENLT